MTYALRPYQETLVSDVTAALSQPSADGLNEVVLAACPGAGKTMMSIDVIQRLLDSGKVRRVLVLAHAMTLLRTQYMEKLIEARPRFTFADYRPKNAPGHEPLKKLLGQVIVTLPQSIVKAKLGAFDLVVVDEAHLYYGEKMVTDIIARTGAKRILLLTGTPAPFVARGVKLYSVSLLELFRQGFVADPMICHVPSHYEVAYKDYNVDGEIGRKVRLTRSQTIRTLDGLLNWFAQAGDGRRKNWPTLLREFHKTMVVCRSQKVAMAAKAYFVRQGVQVALSTSDTDASGGEIERFKKSGGPPLLVVVRRGSLGFDYPDLTAMIDLTGTVNIDRIFQALCRLVRVAPKPRPKVFVRLSPEGLFEFNHAVMNGALSLGDREFYESWNGRDPGGVIVPMPRDIVEGDGTKGGLRTKAKIPDVRFHVFGDFFERIVPQASQVGSTYAMTTIRRVATISTGTRETDPVTHKREILAYHSVHGRTVPPGHRLYIVQSNMINRSCSSYDDEVRSSAEAVGLRSKGKDLVGQVFGRLTVIARAPSRARGKAFWLVRCSCGNSKEVDGCTMRRLKVRSCGCLKLELFLQRKAIKSHGTAHYRSKLTDSMVQSMRKRRMAGESVAALARFAGISLSAAKLAVGGKTWRHVPMESIKENP